MNPPGWVKAIEDKLPVHYSDCDRFNVDGVCDCTASEDIQHLLASYLTGVR